MQHGEKLNNKDSNMAVGSTSLCKRIAALHLTKYKNSEINHSSVITIWQADSCSPSTKILKLIIQMTSKYYCP
jgi:hypothetical protein